MAMPVVRNKKQGATGVNSVFDEVYGLLGEPGNDLVMRAIRDGMAPVGYTCSYVPEALLSAGQLFPVRMRAPGAAGTEAADIYLSSVTCSYVRSLLEYAMDGRYDFLRGWAFAASCDHLRRLYDNLGRLVRPGFIHILDVPHKRGAAAVAWFAEELRIFAAALGGHFGTDTGPGAVAESIRDLNAFNARLRAIGELRKLDVPRLTGGEFHALMLAAGASPKKLFAGILDDLERALRGRAPAKKFRARVVIAGGQLDDPAYINAIEDQGALVVADRLCTGSVPALAPVPEGGDPFAALAAHYLSRTSCPRMMEDHDARVRDIIALAREYRADGVIVQTVKFCDCWGVEITPLARALRDAGLPVLRLEREYHMGAEGQLRTRVQAFIESMGK